MKKLQKKILKREHITPKPFLLFKKKVFIHTKSELVVFKKFFSYQAKKKLFKLILQTLR